jgi:organic radical activating enzyme
MRTREVPESNYGSVFTGQTTLRRKLDRGKSPLPLQHPEVEDVALNTVCHGHCPYCYVSATPQGVNFPSICQKADEVWGTLPEQDRPYQIAIGGAGEPTLHPGLEEFCRKVRALGITPNYTTNGMHMTKELACWTKEVCGGVAVSCHRHLAEHYHKALQLLLDAGVPTSIHVILGAPRSAENVCVLAAGHPQLERVVVLPYQAMGRAPELENKEAEWERFLQMKWHGWEKQLAFGAGFYSFFLRKQAEQSLALADLDLDLYPPEMFSGYRIMDDTYRTLRKSSYNPEER